MTRLSDIIESFIKEMFRESSDKQLQIQRNELANHFSCAPSQINYVLTTRFTTDKGYYIESRRGGGGYITIKRVEFEKHNSLMEAIIEKIGCNITCDGACNIIDGLEESEILTTRESRIMKSAVNDRTINCAEQNNNIRADILKAMIIATLSEI